MKVINWCKVILIFVCEEWNPSVGLTFQPIVNEHNPLWCCLLKIMLNTSFTSLKFYVEL